MTWHRVSIKVYNRRDCDGTVFELMSSIESLFFLDNLSVLVVFLNYAFQY